MKSNNELNRLIAERVLNEALEPPCGYYHETDAANRDEDGWNGWCYNCDCSISEVAPEPRRYCTDPAAWSALWDFLISEGWNVTLDTFADCAAATLRHVWKDRPFIVNDNDKGRALVLATLAAYGVEVEVEVE